MALMAGAKKAKNAPTTTKKKVVKVRYGAVGYNRMRYGGRVGWGTVGLSR